MHKVRRGTFCLLIMALCVGVGFSAHGSGITARYLRVSGDGPNRITVRHCGTGEDSWSTVRLVDYGNSRAILRCAKKGY